MQELIEQLQRHNVLLLLGHEIIESGRLISACQELARLPFHKVVTLEAWPYLVAAWRKAGRAVDVLPLTEAPPRLDESRVIWLTRPSPEEPEPPWLAQLLRNWFAVHTVCILGCDLEDPGFRQRYLEMGHKVGPHRRAYQAIVQRDPFDGDRHYWEGQDVHFTVMDPLDWALQLARVWAEAPPAIPRPDGLADRQAGRPYQFLDYYTEADAGRFFGRAAAARDLGELILAERLVLCFGPSGVGKTSLLQAGLMPRLRNQGCLPLYSRPETDPVQAIRQAASRDILPQVRNLREDREALTELLSGLAQQTQRTVVVLLDQFEEVFTLLGAETTNRLAEELAGCLRLPDASVHVVLSLREDFLAHLHALQLPGLFAHRYRLRPLSREETQEAIEKPAHIFGLGYEPDLVERLLHDLGRDDGGIEPANLQIVCDALYQDLVTRGEETFRLARYQELGGVKQLLGGYLERVVEREENSDQVQAVLKAMVTAQGTKALLPLAEIARLAGVKEGTAAEILQRLDRPHRLVRPLQLEGETRYELAHEVLGPRILAWIADPAEREAKAVHDLLRAEWHNWRSFGALPGPGKLRAVHAQRDNPHLRLGPDEVELMVRGALQHGLEPATWLERVEAIGVPAGDFLLPALASPQAEVRRRAAELLGPKRALAGLSRLIRNADAGVRAQTAATLGEVDHPWAFRLLKRARHDADEAVRAAAWAGLKALNPRAAERLRRCDEATPLLVAASLVYWLLLARWPVVLSAAKDPTWPAWALAGGLWLAALLVLGRLPSYLPVRLLSWVGGGLTAWLLIARWGWLKGGGVLILLLLLGGELRTRPHLGLAALLPYLPLLGAVEATAANVLWTTGGTILALALLTLTVPRWGRYGADRPAAVALLGAALGAAAGGLLAGAGDLGATLVLGIALAAGRWWARRPPAYSGGSQNRIDLLADLGRALWDLLDEFSFKIKPFLGGMVGAVWATVVMRAAAGLAPGAAPAWTIDDALWLGAGLGLGLWWAQGGSGHTGLPPRALLWPTLGGAVGGALAGGALAFAPSAFLGFVVVNDWLAQSEMGAVIGACIGLGLGLGEWLASRAKPASINGA